MQFVSAIPVQTLFFLSLFLHFSVKVGSSSAVLLDGIRELHEQAGAS